MNDCCRTVVVLSFIVIAASTATVFVPGVLALGGDSSGTYADPRAPGAYAEYRVTVTAQQDDAITQGGGLKTITLDFSADPDFSGSVSRVTARDVDVSTGVGNATDTQSLGPVRVSKTPAGDQLQVTLSSVYQQIAPGDQITVVIRTVRNTEIAAPNPQNVRGFALNVSTTGPGGATEGPIEVRYEIDPNATARNQTTSPSAPLTRDTTTIADATATPNATGSESSPSSPSTASGSAGTGQRSQNGSSGSSGQTEAVGPGFGFTAALVAFLALAMLIACRHS